MIAKPRALVLSPSASHPQDYGNRNRVWQVTRFLKQAGYAVDFLFYPFEAEWNERIPPEIEDMRAAWDNFWIAPPTVPLHRRANGEYHELDEWWDESIGNFLSWLFQRQTYDALVVNYTFFSKALTYAPSGVVRILETHDRFSNRKEMLQALGVEPEFFYTTEERERAAFERADIVLAIKDSEAALFEQMTGKTVLPLPFYPTRTAPQETRTSGFPGLSVGFIGALNNVNSANMRAFLDVFEPMLRHYCPPLQLTVAGGVCARLRTRNPAVRLLGKVADVAEFYDGVDVIVAPMTNSTGIKIKVGEALSFGKGVVSTANGFDGYPAIDAMHRLDGLEQVGRSLIKIAYDRDRRAELIAASRVSAQLAERATAVAFQRLARVLKARARRIVFVCDTPFWTQSSLAAVRRAQWFEFCKSVYPVVLMRLHRARPCAGPPGASYVEIDLDGASREDAMAAVAAQLDLVLADVGGADLMIALQEEDGGDVVAAAAARGCGVVTDAWSAPGGCETVDLRFEAPGMRIGLQTTPLRYLPYGVAGWCASRDPRRVLFVSTAGQIEVEGAELALSDALPRRGLTLHTLRARSPGEAMELLFDDVRANPLPAVVLTSGSQRLQRLRRVVATAGPCRCLDVDAAGFPLVARGGTAVFSDIAECLEAALDVEPVAEPGEAPDTGWSALWRLLNRRPLDA